MLYTCMTANGKIEHDVCHAGLHIIVYALVGVATLLIFANVECAKFKDER